MNKPSARTRYPGRWSASTRSLGGQRRLESIGPIYRDRADAANAFNELKNQWGLSGFTTQDRNRCQTVVRACALVYNRRSWYCRAAHPGGRLEALTSPPLLIAAVRKAASHAKQTILYLTSLHGRAHPTTHD